jgi:hypothetical protein
MATVSSFYLLNPSHPVSGIEEKTGVVRVLLILMAHGTGRSIAIIVTRPNAGIISKPMEFGFHAPDEPVFRPDQSRRTGRFVGMPGCRC